MIPSSLLRASPRHRPINHGRTNDEERVVYVEQIVHYGFVVLLMEVA